jgi:hypothetical protein
LISLSFILLVLADDIDEGYTVIYTGEVLGTSGNPSLLLFRYNPDWGFPPERLPRHPAIQFCGQLSDVPAECADIDMSKVLVSVVD